jgi:predicted kinase
MELVLFIGGQGAGKTTFYRQRFADTHVRISLDMLRTRHRERRLVDTCIAVHQSFVIDNTNPTVIDRKRYIDAARASKFQIIGYRFDTPFATMIERNGMRHGRYRVPEMAIKSTLKRLEEPDISEGFDALYRVTALENFEFSVSEAKP